MFLCFQSYISPVNVKENSQYLIRTCAKFSTPAGDSVQLAAEFAFQSQWLFNTHSKYKAFQKPSVWSIIVGWQKPDLMFLL